MSSEMPKTIYLKDYQPSNFLIEKVFLHFDLHGDHTTVKSILTVKRNPVAKEQQAALVLDGEDMQLQSISLDGVVLEEKQYKVNKNSLTIHDVPESFTLETTVLIKPQDNTQLSGLYVSGGNFCTQCESQGFRRITYYLDRPDVLARFNTTITADKSQYPYMLSNGNLIEERDLGNNRHWVHWEDPSLKPCYLFALVAGDFDLIEDTFITMSNREVALKLYLERGFKEQGDFAMLALQHSMQWDEEKFGREYDLDIYMTVAVSDFNMGAMENKGLNIFNTKYILASPETATDTDYVNIEDVVGHEYFHNWTGNRVTCRDWFQLTLKEGLTVLRDQLFTEDITSAAVARLDTANYVRSQQFVEDAGPMAHPIRPESFMEINNFYTKTVYQKGAEVLRMVRTLLSPEGFRKGMDLYFHRHDGQAVTTEDFIKAMEDASGVDLSQFQRWYCQAGTPALQIDGQFDENENTFTLTVKQSCPATPGQKDKEPFYLPLSVGLIGSACKDMATQLKGESTAKDQTRVLVISKPEEQFTFINVAEKPVPSLLRCFSAPVKVHYPYSNEELAWLLRCDSDPFARWDAGQNLCVRVIQAMVKDHNENRAFEIDPVLLEAFQYVLTDRHDDWYFMSRLLVLPSVSYILSNMMGSDVAVIHEAREFIKRELANTLDKEFSALYNEHHDEAYEYSVAEMGKRAVKNNCLAYMSYNDKHHDLAFEQYQKATNMTDAVGALSALNHHECQQRHDALQHFYDKWQHEPLVVNKWLGLHSASILPDTLGRVKELMSHPGFSIRNPNNVYALVCGFGANTPIFHNGSGEGYQFLADQVLAIDGGNSQVAARVIQPLISHELVDQRRAGQMRSQLQRISEAKPLSKDVFEVVIKSLK